jgi:acyl-CoA synthetase (AMP-forming)/AMP-acid ligase II
MSLARLLFQVATTHRADLALSFGDEHLTYEQLCRRAGSIATGFRDAGLRPGDRVLLYMENCLEYLEVLLACWTGGFCAVPVNAKLHRREVEFILESSQASLVISRGERAHDVAQAATARVSDVATEYRALLAHESSAPIELDLGAPAWLFYTSGTTGRPKGATLSHRNLIAMAWTYFADIDPLATTPQTQIHAAPLSHGAGLYALPHLLKGGHQIVLPSFDARSIVDVFAAHENVSMFGAPTMLNMLMDSPCISSLRSEHINTIYYGGGPSYLADQLRAVEVFDGRLYQLYGQGETPMTGTGLTKAMHADKEHPRYRERMRSCGVARTGILVRVVDPDGCDVPVGETGEIVVRGDTVMGGYWGAREATADALRDGWLFTGDIGSLDEDGFLTLTDRSKDVVISGGMNIYSREVEEVLVSHPAVREAAVVGAKDPHWGEVVVAFVVMRPGHAEDQAMLDELCLGNLARFKRPKQYRFVPDLPKNEYGKVLKTTLREELAR